MCDVTAQIWSWNLKTKQRIKCQGDKIFFSGNRRAFPKGKGVWILLGMPGKMCVTNRGRFRKPHVQTDAWMLLTSVGSDSGAFVPRMRRSRKGSGCYADLKSTCLACWGLNKGTVLVLKSVQSLSSTCDHPKVPEPPWGQSVRAAGRGGGGGCIFITLMLECEGNSLNGASKASMALLSPSEPAQSPLCWYFRWLVWKFLALESREPRATSSAGAAIVPTAGCHCMKMMQCHTHGFVDPFRMHMFRFKLVAFLAAGWMDS